jgi:ankyrin repeat protein
MAAQRQTVAALEIGIGNGKVSSKDRSMVMLRIGCMLVIMGMLMSCTASTHDSPLSLELQLIMCAYVGDLEGVRELSGRVNVNAIAGRTFTKHIASQRWTALIAAACQKHLEIVIVLISKGADVNVDDGYGGTPLHYAIKSLEDPSSDEVALKLISAGANVATKVRAYIDGTSMVTPLHDAASIGHQRLVRALITAGADVNAQDSQGSTPLHRACRYSADLDIVKELLDARANPRMLDGEGHSPAHYCRNPAILDLLR